MFKDFYRCPTIEDFHGFPRIFEDFQRFARGALITRPPLPGHEIQKNTMKMQENALCKAVVHDSRTMVVDHAA